MKVRGKTVWSRNPSYVIRDAEMVLMYRDGKTLQEIGDKYGVSRERVRQRLASLGLTRVDGGVTLRMLSKASTTLAAERSAAERREQAHFNRWGMSIQDMAAITKAAGVNLSDDKHPTRKFLRQRQNAKGRGIEFLLTFAEWWQIWQQSGHWDERGRGQGYVMARWADDGPYSADNVYICTSGQNFSDSYITKPASLRAEKRRLNKLARQFSSAPVTPSGVSAPPN